ncbi:MAG: GNAT family N-acetyltransferase [Verrucomicrobiaceae bacterium]|nr:MAG: GNAT family N-acetyltransferase [Verrucomicrobiaceae bacterium]
MTRGQALSYWFHEGTATFVAEVAGKVIGTYILKANQPGLGSHVANASFMVSSLARGHGAGRRMGEHCLEEARKAGFLAMQFNIVISTNEVAVRLWKQLGFEIVGTVPDAYRHSQLGLVDAHVMYCRL